MRFGTLFMHHSVHSEKSNLLSWAIILVFADPVTNMYFNYIVCYNYSILYVDNIISIAIVSVLSVADLCVLYSMELLYLPTENT